MRAARSFMDALARTAIPAVMFLLEVMRVRGRRPAGAAAA